MKYIDLQQHEKNLFKRIESLFLDSKAMQQRTFFKVLIALIDKYRVTK